LLHSLVYLFVPHGEPKGGARPGSVWAPDVELLPVHPDEGPIDGKCLPWRNAKRYDYRRTPVTWFGTTVERAEAD
jgi:hypothetical protein